MLFLKCHDDLCVSIRGVKSESGQLAVCVCIVYMGLPRAAAGV